MRPDALQLKELYAKHADFEIGKMFGVSERSVCSWRKEFGIPPNPRHRAHPVDETQLRELCKTNTDAEIGALLGMSGRSVGNWRDRLDIPAKQYPARRRRGAHTIDVDFFSRIDTEQKAYALGLLAADGYVCRSGKWIAIALQSEDEHILSELKTALRSSAPIRDKISSGGFPGSRPQKVVSFCSRKLVADLSSWGIVPRKSYTFSYPDIDMKMDRHFIRGLLDGDGSVSKRQFCLLGTDALLSGLQERVAAHSGQHLTRSDFRGYPRLVGGRRDRTVLHWLYSDATIFLNRKHHKFLEHWS